MDSSGTRYEILLASEAIRKQINELVIPSPIGFGKVKTPLMALAYFKDDAWSKVKIEPYGPISLDPSAKCLHYGQEIFEGLKCYKTSKGLSLFRPTMNHQRFNRSAKRMAMPEIPEEIFMSAVVSMCKNLEPKIPDQKDQSLYIRPTMIATESGLGLAAAKEYLFFVIASPAGSYFSSNKLDVLIERNDSRASPGGTGFAKAAGNYGGSLNSLIKAKNLGYQQTLFLNSRNKKSIEELSGMNFFAIINGEIYTPALTDSILAGITRESIIQLGRSLGYKVTETTLDIDELISQIKSEECTEIFSCGTAAVISSITALVEDSGEKYSVKFSQGPISAHLRSTLLDIQKCRAEIDYGWNYKF